MAKRAKRTRGGLAPNKYLSKDQIQKLRQYVKVQAELATKHGSQRAVINEMIVELLLYTGLRAAELCNLQVRDLPMHHGKDAIYIRDGKGQISRTVDIPVVMSIKLRQFVKVYRKGAKPASAVIPSERGYRVIHCKTYGKVSRRGEWKIIKEHKEHSSRLTYASLYRRIKKMGEKAGVGRLSPHMLRHTYLYLLYNVEQDLRFVQDQAGHASPTTTAIYAATSNEARRRQVEALGL